MKTKLTILIALLLLMMGANLKLNAQSYSGGSGTIANPYLIANKADLKYLSENSGEWSKHFRQTANIIFVDADFQDGGDFYNGGAGFIPIGNLTEYFTGGYNGDNFTIAELYINRPAQNYIGFFGYIRTSSAYVWNLGLINADITGGGAVGGLVGNNITGTVNNSWATGVVNGNYPTVGGLVGQNSSSAQISNCHADVTVNSSSHSSGGLVGYCYQSSISNCYASGTINGTSVTGGLIGYSYESYVHKSYATGNISGVDYAGGLIGNKYSGAVYDSYARGNVYRSSGSSDYFGGFVGTSYWGSVSKCYSTGSVSGSGWDPDNKGFAGSTSITSYSYNYWDMETSGQTTSAGEALNQLEGKTTAQMKQQATFVTWDFVNNWRISSITNNGYPFHAWQCKNRKYVTVSGAGTFSGDDWANALIGNQLQAAINDPCATEVWVAAGTYYPTAMVGGITDRHKTFQMRNGVAIYGGFPNAGNPGMADRDFVAYETILSGDLGMNDNYSVSPWTGTGENCYHVFFHPDGKNLNQTAILDGFTIKGGNADSNSEPNYHGGGMYNFGSSPTLNHITFRYNATSSWGGGGAIYMRNSTPVATNITLQFNTSAYGGGIYLQQGCEPSFKNWLITDNIATLYGGGVYNASIYTFIFNNATIANNHAVSQGGGIYNAANSIYLRNCIIWGNIATIQGNQIFTNPSGNLVKLEYSCFANGPGDIFSSGVPVSWDGNTIQSDPQFVDAALQDYRIKGISPCADAGNNADNTLTTDIRGAGFGRKLLKTNYLVAGPIDMGAYEFNSNTDPLGYYTLSGTLKYNNTEQTPLNNVELTISPAGANATSTTDAGGNYSFAGLLPGSHTLQVTTIDKEVGYINSTDASQMNAWSVSPSSIERVKWMSGDVNYSGGINSTDAKAVQNFFVYFWPFTRGEWTFWKAGQMVTSGDMNVEIPVTVTGDLVVDLLGQAVGDFNGSFVPGNLKAASSTLGLSYGETRQAGAGTEVELPVRIVHSEEIGAVSLILNYPAELLEITGVDLKLENGNLDWMAKGGELRAGKSGELRAGKSGELRAGKSGELRAGKSGELRAGWNSLNPQWFDAGSVLMTIHGRVSASFGNGDEIRFTLAPDPLNELADEKFNVIPDAILQMDVLAFSTTGTWNPEPGTWNGLTLLASPNPFRGYSIVDFRLPMEGHVTLEITDMLGRRVALLVDEQKVAGEYSMKLNATPLQPGIYMATLKLKTSDGDLVKTIKLIRQQ